MTLVDTADLRDRTCRHCGAVVWDRVTHQRWHHETDEAIATVSDALDHALDGIEFSRQLIGQLTERLHAREGHTDATRDR